MTEGTTDACACHRRGRLHRIDLAERSWPRPAGRRRPRRVHRLLPAPDERGRTLSGWPALRVSSFGEVDLRTDDLEPGIEGARCVVHEAAMAGLMRSWTDLERYTRATCSRGAPDRGARGRGRALRAASRPRRSTGPRRLVTRRRPTRAVVSIRHDEARRREARLAHVGVHGFPGTIIRYFSIYGPRQRPDMAYHLFTEAMLDGRPITVFGDGEQTRSNTYIGDAVTGTIRAIEGRLGGSLQHRWRRGARSARGHRESSPGSSESSHRSVTRPPDPATSAGRGPSTARARADFG